MPLQNRVTPFGELIATPARGTMYGNRGGRFHRDDKTLGARRWSSRQWICCVLSFKGRHHEVWARRYTALFFLDEVTALAAGHRPCFECRRADATAFAEKWAQTKGSEFPYVDEMDRVLQGRAARRPRKAHARDADRGFARWRVSSTSMGPLSRVRGSHLLRWSENGYTEKIARPRGMANVLTPPSIVAVLKAGYSPQWHPSADTL